MATEKNWETHTIYTEKDFEGYTVEDFEKQGLHTLVLENGYAICKHCSGAENDLNLIPCTKEGRYNIHRRLTLARQLKKYSQEQVAQLMGITLDELIDIEQMRVDEIPSGYITLFCKLLSINIKWVVEGLHEPVSRPDVTTDVELQQAFDTIKQRDNIVLKELVVALTKLHPTDLDLLNLYVKRIGVEQDDNKVLKDLVVTLTKMHQPDLYLLHTCLKRIMSTSR